MTAGRSPAPWPRSRPLPVPAILVSFGYATSPLKGSAAEAVIDHFDELPARAHAVLNGLPTGRARL